MLISLNLISASTQFQSCKKSIPLLYTLQRDCPALSNGRHYVWMVEKEEIENGWYLQLGNDGTRELVSLRLSAQVARQRLSFR